MSDPAGYSGTPLAQKLGLKDGQRALFIDLPGNANVSMTVALTEDLVIKGVNGPPQALSPVTVKSYRR